MAGTPPKTTVQQASGGGSGPSPGYDWAKGFFSSLPGVFNSPYPSQYPGQLDPGMSPTMQNVMRQAQGYGTSPAPSVLQGVQGTLGSFMSPNFINPQMRAGMGYPDYFGTNPAASTYGGGTVGQLPGFNPMTGQGGMQTPQAGMQAAMAGSSGRGLGGAFTGGGAWGQPASGAGIEPPGGGFGGPGTSPSQPAGISSMPWSQPPSGGGWGASSFPLGLPASGPGSMASYLPGGGSPTPGAMDPMQSLLQNLSPGAAPGQPTTTPSSPDPFQQFLARWHQHQLNHPGVPGGDGRPMPIHPNTLHQIHATNSVAPQMPGGMPPPQVTMQRMPWTRQEPQG